MEYIEYQGETDADDNGHDNGDDKSPHDGLPSEYQLTCSSLPSLPDKDAPFHRAIQRLGAITSQPILGGLHTNIVESNFRYTQQNKFCNMSNLNTSLLSK